ncbi:hypothetical protein SAMN05216356_101161 [Oribacterium sp. WCC10]|nr:hypothetical protein SAMN05216356_101161 [Oribacterium sp. WCC10]
MAAVEKQDTSNVIKHHNLPRLNVGMVIFMIIFLYIVFSVYSYVTRDQVRFYEVLDGNIVRQEQYTGVAIREEEAVDASSSGYIHYFIQDGRRVAAGSNVYMIDETGALEAYLKDHPELTQEMSGEQVSDIRYRLSQFSQTFRNSNFSYLYDVKFSLDATAMEYTNISNAQDLDSVVSEIGINYSQVHADKAGVVSYSVDGKEGLTPDAVTADIFSMNGYKMNITKPGSLIEGGTPAYKIITSSNWYLVFPVNDELKEKYQDIHKVQVYFPEKDVKSDAQLDIYTAADGNNYGKLYMKEFMEEFCNERFVQFSIITNNKRGLKLPLTAITQKDFFIIPKDFMVINPDGSTGFNRQIVAEDGSGTTTEFVESEIYRIDDQYCYVTVPESQDQAGVRLNDFVIKPGMESGTDGANAYHVGPVKSLQGVYNINRGYCVFRQIVPIEQNNEYVIVEKNTDHGIAVYDHIVMDASLVSDGQLVYQ